MADLVHQPQPRFEAIKKHYPQVCHASCLLFWTYNSETMCWRAPVVVRVVPERPQAMPAVPFFCLLAHLPALPFLLPRLRIGFLLLEQGRGLPTGGGVHRAVAGGI